MTKYSYVGDPFVREQEVIQSEPLPVGQARTHTIRFDDPPPVDVSDKRHRRKQIGYALAECVICTYMVQWFIVAFPRGISRDYGIPTIVGLPLAIVLAFVWIAITFVIVNGIWPKDG